MSFLKRYLPAICALSAVLSCDTFDHSGESALLTIKVDSGATRFGKLYVILVDSAEADTLWKDSLEHPDQLRRLATERYRGGQATLIIEGHTGGAKVYEERRAFTGAKPATVKRDTLRDVDAPLTAFAWSQKLVLLPFGDSSHYDTLRILPVKADRRVRITLSDSTVVALRDSAATAEGIRFRLSALKSGQSWIHAASIADPSRRDSASVRVASGSDAVPQPINLTPYWHNTARPTWTWKPGGTGGSGFYDIRLDDDGLAGDLIGDTAWKSVSPLADGPHTLFVRAEGSKGLFSVVNGMVLKVDTEAPNAPKVSNAAFSATDNPRPAWTWARQGGGMGRFRVKLDDSSLANATTVDSLKYSAPDSLAVGPHTLYVQESDSAGNWSRSGSATVSVVPPDRIPPEKPFRQAIYYGISDRYVWRSGGGGAGVFRYLVDKSDFAKDGPVETPNAFFVPGPDLDTASGPHTLYVQERDSVGNWSDAAAFAFQAYRFTFIRSRADTTLVMAVAADSVNIVLAPLITTPRDADETEALHRQLWHPESDARVPAPHRKWSNLFLNAQLKHRGIGLQLQVEGFSGTDVDTAKFWSAELIGGFTGGRPPPDYYLIPLASTARANVGEDEWTAGKAVVLREFSGGLVNELWVFGTYTEKWFMQ